MLQLEVWPLISLGPCKNSCEIRITEQRNYTVLLQFCWDYFKLFYVWFGWLDLV